MINVNLIILVAVAPVFCRTGWQAGTSSLCISQPVQSWRTVGEPAVTVISHSDNNFALR